MELSSPKIKKPSSYVGLDGLDESNYIYADKGIRSPLRTPTSGRVVRYNLSSVEGLMNLRVQIPKNMSERSLHSMNDSENDSDDCDDDNESGIDSVISYRNGNTNCDENGDENGECDENGDENGELNGRVIVDVNEDGRGGGVSGMYMKNYNISMVGFVYYCVFCIIIPITINELSQQNTLYSANIIFNFYLSPVLYNICFKWHFVYLYRNNRRMLFMYPFFILIGFGIRLLDMIPYLQTFVLSTVDFNYNSWGHKILFWSLVLYLNVIFVVEIMATVHWRLNMLLLFIGIGFMYLSLLSFVNLGVVYHIHHYFIGVMMHVICQRKKNIFSRLNNGIGLGVYLEGISKWGYANIVV